MDPGAPTQDQQAPIFPPPPPPPPAAPAYPYLAPPVPQPKAGQLSSIWRLLFGIGWAAIVLGNAAVWEASRVIGLSTWWLGADSEPRMLLFQLLPFYGPILVTVAAISNWRYIAYFGILVGLAGAAIGLGDLDRVRWIATVELVLAGAAVCISVASLAGTYRRVRVTGDSVS